MVTLKIDTPLLSAGLSLVVGISLPIQAHADMAQCLSIIPPQGAYHITLQGGQTQSYSTAKEWFCSSNFSSWARQSSVGGSVAIPIDDVPFKGSFNADDQQQQTSRQQFCSDSNRTFNEQQSLFIYEKSGDQITLNAVLQCMTQQPFLEVATHSLQGDTFEVDVSSRSFPGPNPLIIDIHSVAGASAVSIDALRPGARIPFSGSGTTPAAGVFQYTNPAQGALVEVTTTIGTKQVTAKKCATGQAGTWSVSMDVSQTTNAPTAPFVQQVTVPQGWCHPHCQPGQGTPFSIPFQAPGNDIINNPRHICLGGPPCPLNEPITDSQVTPQIVQISGLARTVAMAYQVIADRYTPTTAIHRQQVGNGTMNYGQQFSFTLGNTGNPTVAVVTPFGQVEYGANALVGSSLVPWLAKEGQPQASSTGTLYNMKVIDASCTP